jgi:hypothetical protein
MLAVYSNDRSWPFAEIGGDEKHGRFIAAYGLKAVIRTNNKTLAAIDPERIPPVILNGVILNTFAR